MIDLYLDIDGVLLTKHNTTIAEYADEFIKFVCINFNCYWLTTHCKADTNTSLDYLAPYFEHLMDYLSKIKPSPQIWETLKTEGIDFSRKFYWIEDNPFMAEKKILKEYGCVNSLIEVNLNRPNELKNIISLLQKYL